MRVKFRKLISHKIIACSTFSTLALDCADKFLHGALIKFNKFSIILFTQNSFACAQLSIFPVDGMLHLHSRLLKLSVF